MKEKTANTANTVWGATASVPGGVSEMTPETKKNILRSRAQRLAREVGTEVSSDKSLDVLAFLLAHETYAVETVYVREVCPLNELTPLPCTPAFIRGIIHIRGQILTVIDMKRFFDLPERGITDLNRIIVVREDDTELGILADDIVGIRTVPEGDIHPPLSAMDGIRTEYLRGLTGERLIVLDIRRLLADRQLIVNEEVEA